MALLELQDVSIDFPLHHGSSRSMQLALYKAIGTKSRTNDRVEHVHAIKSQSLTIEDGERVAIIGRNGAGKTTLLRTLAGVYPPTSGRVEIKGSVSSLTDITLGMDSEATGFENIQFRLVFMGLSFRQARKMTADIVQFTELGDSLARPIRTYSTGMYLRLAFAISTAIHPDILILDEMINAGDTSFQEKARARIDKFITKSKILVISTHDVGTVRNWCNRAIWMDHGQIIMDGNPEQVLEAYLTYSNNTPLGKL